MTFAAREVKARGGEASRLRAGTDKTKEPTSEEAGPAGGLNGAVRVYLKTWDMEGSPKSPPYYVMHGARYPDRRGCSRPSPCMT